MIVREPLMNQKHATTLTLAAIILFGAISNAVPLGNAEAAWVEVIVGFRDAPNVELLRQVGGEILQVYDLIPAVYASVPKTALAQLQADPKVAYVEENSEVKAAGTVRWAVESIGAPQAWSQSTGLGVKVAVLDSGVGPVNDVTVYGGYDFINNDDDARDDFGHGTMVAGIIAASVESSLGIAGVAPNAQLYSVKVLNSEGKGTLNQAILGIQWAVSHGMQIISMSWNLVDSNNLRNAVDAAYNQGVLLVGAAGNVGEIQSGLVGCPACYESVIAVSATKENNVHLESSCVGEEIELAAPGEMVYSIGLDNTTWCGNGTSYATGYVSGTAALVWAKNPSLTNVQVRAILAATAVDLQPSDGQDRDIFYGYGLVNASAAVAATPSNSLATFSWTPSRVYAGVPVHFDASASFGGVSGFTSYQWSFGDGATATETSPVVAHTFASQGDYTVNLLVSNEFGFSNSTARTVEVLQDTQAPSTSDNYDDALHTSPFTITLTASDGESGVAETYYRINDGASKRVSVDGHPQITVDGLNNKLEYWSVDCVGNEESPHKVVSGIKLDTTPQATPTPTPTVEPKDGEFPFWAVAAVVLAVGAAVAVALVAWFRRK
jgi:subtilisin family serine protease